MQKFLRNLFDGHVKMPQIWTNIAHFDYFSPRTGIPFHIKEVLLRQRHNDWLHFPGPLAPQLIPLRREKSVTAYELTIRNR
jgi:hypothetical protein